MRKHPGRALNAESYNSVNGETTAALTGITASWSSSGCTVTIGGASSTARGRLEIKYTNSTHKLELMGSGSNLHIYNVSSACPPRWNTGDHLTISGTYAVTSAQTITSP